VGEVARLEVEVTEAEGPLSKHGLPYFILNDFIHIFLNIFKEHLLVTNILIFIGDVSYILLWARIIA
jgi:hypothetical protein